MPSTTISQRFKRIAEFETFNESGLCEMLDATTLFAASLNYTQPYWLTLAGTSGVGKSHLAKAVMRQFMDQNRFELKYNRMTNHIMGNTGTFVNWRRFCARVRDGGYGEIDHLCDEWFVVIDDLGSERDPSGFIASATDRILNDRLGKWTLITTNLTLSQVAEKIDVRVASRMLRDNGVVVECKARDYNLRKREAA